MTILETLEKARALISAPERWTKHANARDGNGSIVRIPDYKEAACWCAVGAVITADDENWGDTYQYLIGLVRCEGLASHPEDFNDDPATTHADILALFDRAIAAERAKVQP